MSALKQIAAREDIAKYRQSTLFYKKFLDCVRRRGRVNEMAFMTLYCAALKNPWSPLKFGPLGLKLMMKGKVSILPHLRGPHPLESIFRKTEALEKRS